jgi:transmembrane sensor
VRTRRDADLTGQEASEWMARRDAGFTPAEAAAFDQWWRADPRHAIAIARLESAEHRLRGLRHFSEDGDFRSMSRGAGPAGSGIFRAVWLPWAVAAAFAFLLLKPRGTPAEPQAPAEFATTENGYQRILLAGGIIQLNERTALRPTVEPGGAELLRGEASFTVLPGAPAFFLRAGNRRISCSAGSFVVRKERDEVAVLVTGGEAEIQVSPAENLRVTPGTRVTIVASGAAPFRRDQVTPAQMQEVLAWQAPRLPLAETRLADAIEQFNLFNWEQFELADRALAERRVSGIFRADGADEFIAYLRREHRIAVERVNRASSSDRNSPGGIALLLRPLP